MIYSIRSGQKAGWQKKERASKNVGAAWNQRGIRSFWPILRLSEEMPLADLILATLDL
jgi:hypothetical protein